jgi:hypothetical protein
VLGRGRLQLHDHLRGGHRDRGSSHTGGDRVFFGRDLRRFCARGDRVLCRIRQRGQRLVTRFRPDVHHHCDIVFEHRLISDRVLGWRRLQLRVHLRARLRGDRPGPIGHRGLEWNIGLRRRTTGRDTHLRGIHSRGHRGLTHHAADMHDLGDVVERRGNICDELLRCGGCQLRHLLRARPDDRGSGAARDHRLVDIPIVRSGSAVRHSDLLGSREW